jgi:hypothetical protein
MFSVEVSKVGKVAGYIEAGVMKRVMDDRSMWLTSGQEVA